MASLGQNKHEEGICTETGPGSSQVGLLTLQIRKRKVEICLQPRLDSQTLSPNTKEK